MTRGVAPIDGDSQVEPYPNPSTPSEMAYEETIAVPDQLKVINCE
jgi:hypothetical protein